MLISLFIGILCFSSLRGFLKRFMGHGSLIVRVFFGFNLVPGYYSLAFFLGVVTGFFVTAGYKLAVNLFAPSLEKLFIQGLG